MANLTIDNLASSGMGHESDQARFQSDAIFDEADSETKDLNTKSRTVLVIDDDGSITRMYAELLEYMVDTPRDIYIVGPKATSATMENHIMIKQEDAEAAKTSGQMTVRRMYSQGIRPALAIVDGLNRANRMEEVVEVLIQAGVKRIVVASADVDIQGRVDAIKAGPLFTHKRRHPNVTIETMKKPFQYTDLERHLNSAYDD